MVVIAGLICGGISAAIASTRGRNVIAWFFGGFFLGIFGVILVACLPNLKLEAQRRAMDAMEHQRLREKLRQEQMKNEAFRRHAAQRLDRHDRALDLDTRETQAMLADQQSSLPRPGAGSEAYIGWYYEKNGETIGPVQQTVLARMLQRGTLAADVLVCREDQEQWTPAREVHCFRWVIPL